MGAALAAMGCASGSPRLGTILPEAAPAKLELTAVPFFPQAESQCGPAALATVLAASGRTATPDELAPKVYLPGRHGSLQTELVAAIRSYDRLAYRLAPGLGDAVAQLAAGRPVLVLQNLGVRVYPVWHFAVLVGYDAATDRVVLRSGTTERLVRKRRLFDRTWARSGRWAVVALDPTASADGLDPERYLRAAAELEAVGRVDAAGRAYRSAGAAWPESAWPWLGIGNLAWGERRLDVASDAYREALARDPGNVAARNNLAEVLAVSGCTAAARTEATEALARARGTPLEEQVRASAARILSGEAATHDAPGCQAPAR